ncbi:TonB-dependent receptor domain-containing protein [Caulobacter sp. KR2-114]|uniref:TonB-dependent receptor domain-containing protein n=1 Tax=Caulobacter sp. KR2-114 TaxID=3400912 RepID=UPI003BFCAE28
MMRDWRTALLAGAGVAAVAMAAGPAAAQDQAVDFHIAAQPMDKAINALSAQSGVRVLYPYDQVAGLTSPTISGRMPARAALQRLIAHTPLRISLVQNGLIALSAPVKPASPGVTKVGTAPVAASVATVAATAAAQVQATDPGSPPPPAPPGKTEAAADTPAEIGEVTVTGVRGRPRTVMDSPTPIDVLGQGDLEKTGRVGVFQAMQTLVPSFNQPFRAGGGTATIISTGGLRGLNPDQTLVLVNGKRRHKTSLINAVSSLYNGSVPADLDMLPTTGIGRIEVLRDGAAAQYGSDAIAGVINIILKDKPGGLLTATAGQNIDRSDGQYVQLGGEYGFRATDKGFFTAFFNYKDQKSSNRANPVAPSVQIYPKINGQLDPREASVNRLITWNYGQLPQRGANLGYNGHYDLNDNVQFYSFGTYSWRRSDLNFTFRSPNSANTIPQLYPEGFRPDLVIEENDYEFAVGARGVFHGWNWDLSSTYGYNGARENVYQSENASLGPASPTQFYVGMLESTEWVNSLDLTRDFKSDSWGDMQVSLGAQHRRETYQVSAGEPASYAAGTYQIPAGQPFAGTLLATGAQAAPGFQPTDASFSARNNYAVYAEFGYTPIKKLFLDGAVRYEDYDDSSGSTVIGKVSGRYELTSWLSLRGAVSNGFRAPALAQEHYAASSSQFRLVNGVLTLLQIKTLPVNSPAAIALGAQPLKPETSRNYSVGVTLSPISHFNVTVDAYQIDVDHRIAITSTLTGAAVNTILTNNGLPANLSAQYYTNAINTRTRGIDVVATYQLDLDAWGQLKLNFGYNYNQNTITHIIANPSQLSALGSGFVLFDRLSQGYLTTALPKDKIALGGNWSWRKFELNLRATRYGGFTVLQNPATPAVADQTFRAKWITDLELAYHLPNNFTVAVGANNLFNVYPSAAGTYNVNLGSGQYPGTSPFGFTGGSYYGRVMWSF